MRIIQTKGVDFLNIVALVLVILGAINWGLIGFFQWDLIAAIFGGQSAVLSRIIYALVGLAGLWAITFFAKLRRRERD